MNGPKLGVLYILPIIFFGGQKILNCICMDAGHKTSKSATETFATLNFTGKTTKTTRMPVDLINLGM